VRDGNDDKAAWNRRASGWISVEERLPEDGGLVLVHGGCAYCKNGEWMSVMDEGYRRPQTILWTVTHWMPLPEPPEKP